MRSAAASKQTAAASTPAPGDGVNNRSRFRTPYGICTPRRGGLAILLGLLTLATVASSAQAAITHPYTGTSFGPGGVGSGSFESATGVAVQQSTGDVFVLENGNGGRVYKFDAAGIPVDFSSTGTNMIKEVGSANGSEAEIAVDNSTGPDAGDIYVANNNAVKIYSAAGASIGELSGGEMCGVAVDPSGHVYVGIYPETVRRYAPSTSPVTNADEDGSIGGLSGVCNVAVDAAGDVYAARYSGEVTKYDALQFGSLAVSGELVDPKGRTLAVDPTSGEAFIDEVERVAQYEGSAVPPARVGTSGVAGLGALSGSFGVAVNHASGEIYAGDGEKVAIFGASTVVPDAMSEAPSGVTPTSATLNGSVDPDGTVTTYQFEYGASTSYGSYAPASPAAVGSDSTVHHLTANLTGLAPSSTYHYRISASNANGTNYGADETLNTPGPPTIESTSSERVGPLYAQLRAVVDPHGLDTHANFEYGTSTAYGSSTPSVDLGSEEAEARAEVTGLAASVTYHYRVVTSNSEGTVYGPDESFTTTPATTIGQVSIRNVGSSTTTFQAYVETYLLAAKYHLEYGTTSAYGADTPSFSLSGQREVETATVTLSELEGGRSYHFRLVVENEAGVGRTPDGTFTTEAATAPAHTLPDGRGYEKVSPNANANGDVYQDVPLNLGTVAGYTEQPFLVAPEGNAVAYMGEPSEHGGTGSEGPENGNQYLATRDANGRWSGVNVDPPSSSFADQPVFKGFSPDLSVGFVNSSNPGLASGAPGGGFPDLYAETLATGSFTPLIKTVPEHRTPLEFGAPSNPRVNVSAEELAYAGSSANLGHDLFMANDVLAPDARDGGEKENNLYDSSGGATTLVNVLPDGSTEPNATFGGPHLAIDAPYGGKSYNYPILGHDISEDGSRIFWTDLNTGDLYVRENDTAPQSPSAEGRCTIPADACTILIAEEAQYWNATPDGSKVLYTKAGDLYEHDLESGQTTDLAPNGKVHGVTATSSDLSYVYFVAEAALAPGAEPQTCVEGEGGYGSCNLYAVHIGEPTRFIAALSGGDNVTTPESFARFSGNWQGSLGDTEAEATPSGTHLLFTSKAHLTGYQSGNTGQVFMYDFASGELHCLSCKPTGESIVGTYSAFLPDSNLGTSLPHWISDDGSRAFFDTLDALVPQDTNKTTDVYEWERDGAGSCNDGPGCLSMLSDGTSPEGSYLIGSSTSGDDVFITTRGKQVPDDENENTDVYDVRVGATGAPVPTRCTGSGCQGVPATPPIFATPPSATYRGIGNLRAAVPAPAVKPLTRAQKLARALKACKSKAKKKRASCVAQAKKRYGPTKKKRPSPSMRRSNVKKTSGRGH